MPRLILNPTSANRREIPLAGTALLTIGRDPSNDLVLPDAMVSRRHAVVECRGGQFVLRDCSSANGSVVNGDRVSERGLRDGDLVAIGSMRLLFRDEPLESGGGGKVLAHPSAAPLACAACGGAYRRGDLFCRTCGTRVALPSGPPKALCASCSTAVPLPARFCPACGAALGSEGPGEASPEPGGEGRDTRPLPRVEDEPAPPRPAGSMAIAPEHQAFPPRPSREPERRPAPLRASPTGRPRDEVARAGGGEPAEPLRRLAAFAVDAVFVLSGQAVLLAPVGWYWWAREAPRSPGDVSFAPILASATLVPLALLLGALYHVYFWSVKGATPGKQLLDLRVETEDGVSPLPLGRAVARVFGYLLGAASLGIGLLPVAFGAVGLHDRIAGTRVVVGGSS